MLVPLIFSIFLSVCLAGVPAKPAVECNKIPPAIYTCMGRPTLIDQAKFNDKECEAASGECEKISCYYRQLGWLQDGKVDKQKVLAHFEKFAKDYPEWSPAVENMKTSCLSETLPAQGIHLNCSPYDIMLCSSLHFIKNAPAGSWVKSDECQHVKQHAEVCSLCPEECYAPNIPKGSCNACPALVGKA